MKVHCVMRGINILSTLQLRNNMEKLEIKMRNISKNYDKKILNKVDLDVSNESFISIVGKSGSGKTTLLNIIGLIESFDEGEYYFDGKKIQRGKDYNNIRLNNIGYIYQSYNLINYLSCRENILVPLLYKRNKKNEFENIVSDLQIKHLLDCKVSVLSGGEKQRVAIARALILNPKLLIADEPTGNLDDENKKIIFELLHKEHNKGKGVIVITHDEETAKQADTIYTLSEGVLSEKK